MMSGIRDASKGVFGKIVVGVLMGLLILSFAIWGINDVFRGGSQTDVAVVGREKITTQEYLDAYRRLLARIQRERGITPTTAQIRAEGLDRQLLDSMIGDAALDGKAKALGLSYSVTDAARAITTDSRFQQNGQFNRDMFNGFLQNANMSEQFYLSQLVSATLRRHVEEAVAGGKQSPAVIAELFHKRTAEERTISLIRINESRIEAVAAPDDATLKPYFEENQANFRAPEFRSVTYLAIDPKDFAGEITVSDSDITAEYDEGLKTGRYGSPERRTVQQLSFPDRATALAALERIRAGTGMDAIALETNQMGTLDAGARTKADIGVPALADPIFALASGGVTDVIEASGQFIIARVSAITPAVVPPLDDALKVTIRDMLRANRIATDPGVRAKVGALHDAIEELRGSGKTLAEIAAEKSLKAVEVPSVNAMGQDKANAEIALPEPSRFVPAIFNSAVGVDNEAIPTSTNGWIWFEMSGREEARNLTFDEAKLTASTRWIEEEKARRIGAKADEVLKAIEGGKTLLAEAATIGAAVETQPGLRRFTQPFGVEAGSKIFVTPVGKAATAVVSRQESLVFEVTDSKTPVMDANSDEIKQTKELLSSLVSEDLTAQYTAAIEAQAGVTRNDAALANAIGAQ